jgi:hypothetical protein
MSAFASRLRSAVSSTSRVRLELLERRRRCLENGAVPARFCPRFL